MMPKALPEEVVIGIWREVFEQSGVSPLKDFDEVMKSGALEVTTEFVRKFVEVAIDHPHYANAKEICSATGIKYGRVYDAMNFAKADARNNRSIG
jgi:aspartate/tyrosine/aromatic aminotransferase